LFFYLIQNEDRLFNVADISYRRYFISPIFDIAEPANRHWHPIQINKIRATVAASLSALFSCSLRLPKRKARFRDVRLWDRDFPEVELAGWSWRAETMPRAAASG